ncbi:MAG: hypothetical protein QW607_06470 [Desulfurococcaceae archaeon]
MVAENKTTTKVVFKGRVSKKGDRYIINIPKKLNLMVQHGKEYIVTLEEVEEKEG